MATIDSHRFCTMKPHYVTAMHIVMAVLQDFTLSIVNVTLTSASPTTTTTTGTMRYHVILLVRYLKILLR